MIDYERQKESDKKEREKSEALNLINMINSGSDPLTAFEAYEYINRLRELTTSLKKYSDMLFENFPDEMEAMYKKSQEYSLMQKESSGAVK